MAKSEYLKMIGYGELLESLLDNNLSQWSIAGLINNAASLLNINYNIKKNAHFIKLIDQINLREKETLSDAIVFRYSKIHILNYKLISFLFNETEEYEKENPDFNKLDKLRKEIGKIQKEVPWDELPEIEFSPKEIGDDPNKELYSAVQAMTKNGLEEKSVGYFKISAPVDDVIVFFGLINFIRLLAQHLKNSNRPWQQSVPVICQELDNNPTASDDVFTLSYKVDPFRFINAYNEISDVLFINNDTITLERSLTDSPIQEEDGRYTHVPALAIISNIFFDFLFLGGQDYYGFCEHCDKFFVIQRKGRKIYCSDICRVNANKSKNFHHTS
ncbi:MAG: hypothetical protein ABFS18_02205 [Thermodesulfobacteriota bacterium]